MFHFIYESNNAAINRMKKLLKDFKECFFQRVREELETIPPAGTWAVF